MEIIPYDEKTTCMPTSLKKYGYRPVLKSSNTSSGSGTNATQTGAGWWFEMERHGPGRS